MTHVQRAFITTTISEKGISEEVELAPFEDPSDTTLQRIIDEMGVAFYESLPVLDLGETDGRTGYIDFIEEGDMSHPIMKGADRHGRPFIAFRLQYTTRRGKTHTGVETIFRRYTDGPVWVSGGNGRFGDSLCISAMSDEDIAYMGRLVRGEDIGKRSNVNTKYSEVPEHARNVKTDGDYLVYESGEIQIR